MKKNIFNSIQLVKPGKSMFDLSHDVKMSMNMGELAPTLCMECVPGDRIRIGCESMVRMAPLLAPVMDIVKVTNHYWFVPVRLLWPGWEKFITGARLDDTLPEFPYAIIDDAGANAWGKLADYLGLPPAPAGGYKVNVLPFFAYQMIWNTKYRDQNLITEINTQAVDGDNTATAAVWNVLRNRAWEHDYFTSALPTAQAGSPVDLPIGTVELDPDWNTAGDAPTFYNGTPGPQPNGPVEQVADIVTVDDGVTNQSVAYDPDGSLHVAPTTISDLRKTFRLQEWLEKTIRSGARLIESIFAHFGERVQDYRLQNPEYITGTVAPVVISEVLNNTGTTERPQGDMAGHGAAVTSGDYGYYHVREHGFIICLTNVQPKTSYQDGIPKHFLKFTDPFQYFWPEFEHIGEQPIENQEVFAQALVPEGTFGYVPRYSEYKFQNSRVAGSFRNTQAFWHFGRKFISEPALNGTFVTAVPRVDPFAVEEGDHIWMHQYHRIKALRPMSKYGNPSF